MKIKYDMNMMKYISLFSSISGASVKDCIETEGRLLFIVDENQIAKAIGKNGSNIKKISNTLKRQIKVIGFSQDVAQFVRNYVHPIKPGISEEDGVITIAGNDTREKGILIGRNSANVQKLKDIVSRYFDIKEIKVV